MNTEFVGMKPPTVLRDELSVKHEALRKQSPTKRPYMPPVPNTNTKSQEVADDEEDNEMLFIDVPTHNYTYGNYIYLYINIYHTIVI